MTAIWIPEGNIFGCFIILLKEGIPYVNMWTVFAIMTDFNNNCECVGFLFTHSCRAASSTETQVLERILISYETIFFLFSNMTPLRLKQLLFYVYYPNVRVWPETCTFVYDVRNF